MKANYNKLLGPEFFQFAVACAGKEMLLKEVLGDFPSHICACTISPLIVFF